MNEQETTIDLRGILLETIEGVRSGKVDARKASAIASLSKVVIASAKLDLDYASAQSKGLIVDGNATPLRHLDRRSREPEQRTQAIASPAGETEGDDQEEDYSDDDEDDLPRFKPAEDVAYTLGSFGEIEPAVIKRGDIEWEKEMVARAQSGDREAMEKLWASHFCWVKKLTTKFAMAVNWDVQVALSEAAVVFIEIVGRCDSSKSRLTTLISIALVQGLRRSRNRDNPVKIPQGYNGAGHKYHEEVQRAIGATSYDDPDGPYGEMGPPGSYEVDYEREAEGNESLDVVLDSMECLSQREREILGMRYLEGKTLEEVGSVIGVTRERVRQIEKKSLTRLRNQLGVVV